MMKKMVSVMGALCALVSTASAAMATVWTPDGPGTMAPAYWYSYTYGTGASVDTMTTADNVKVAEFTATAGKTGNGAGFGFAWKQNNSYADVPVSLASYKGVCLTYRATAPFRIDFKQSTITDDNYYGAELAAGTKRTFIAFSGLKQGWTSKTTVSWAVTQQIGVQFSYKNTHATSTVNTNTVEIVNIALATLADDCGNHVPNLVSGVTSPDAKDLYEGDTLRVAFRDIFEDADGDSLSITMSLSGYAKDLKDKKSYSLSDTAMIKSKANPTGSNTNAAAIFIATDSVGGSVSYTLALTLIDRSNAPVAVDDNYVMNEDDTLVVSSNDIMTNDYDADDNGFTATLRDSTSHGELVSFNGLTGKFTYVPEPNFYGTDSFTYFITDEDSLISNLATVTITVKNVNDPATLAINDSLFYIDDVDGNEYKFADGISVEEDFTGFDLLIPTAEIVFTDPDVADANFEVFTRSKMGKVGTLLKKRVGYYMITVSPIADANGEDAIQLFILDGVDTVGFSIPLSIAPVADKPRALDDAYTVVQDSENKIAANKGVLKNDVNPDGKTTLKAYLLSGAAEGTVTLAEDGSFTYAARHYEGTDSFTYVAVNAEGDSSLPATVTLTVEHKNLPPQIVAGVADTVGNRLSALTEDFSGMKRYTAAEIKSWFTDDEDTTLTFTARTDDSLLAPTMVSGVLQIRAVKDACGDAEVIVIAADSKGAKKELAIPAKIACVNDRPVFVKYLDSLFVGTEPVWTKAFDLKKWVSDPDGEELKYDVSAIGGADASISMAMDGDNLILSSLDGVVLEPGAKLYIKVVVSDSLTETAMTFIVFATDAPPASIKPVVAAAPKATWQNAILANRGAVALFDMQGRVMWKAKLPVSEAQVRAAAAQVQGRKILQVNKQTWTIK